MPIKRTIGHHDQQLLSHLIKGLVCVYKITIKKIGIVIATIIQRAPLSVCSFNSRCTISGTLLFIKKVGNIFFVKIGLLCRLFTKFSSAFRNVHYPQVRSRQIQQSLKGCNINSQSASNRRTFLEV